MTRDATGPIDAAIAALQAQRALLGDAVVDTALAALHARRAAASGAEGVDGAAEQQLRLVSVLFCDVVGSTAFGRQLDPEDLHQLLDGALARFTAIVREHQGVVLQYAGDSMLAVFGTPLAREDDAERALLAGLAILDEGRAQAAAVRARFGREGFGLRVGVHTGPVLLGGGVDGAQSIRGMTVHIAARMEQTAPAGGLRISRDTARVVRGLFEVQRQPPLEVKGLEEPVDTWLVLGARPAAERRLLRGVDGLQTPLVGRGAELGALESAYESVRSGAQGPAFVTVIGDAGLGKSRLALEFDHWLARRPEGLRRLQASAFERDGGRPYGLLRVMFLRWLGIYDSDAAAAARAQWLDGMAPLLRSRGDAAVLGHLLGLDFADEPDLRGLLADARQLRDRAFFHAAQVLRALAGGEAPLVVLLDDLHWADEGSLDFVEQVLAKQAGMRLLLVGFTRPSLHERRPHWLAAAANACRIDLQPLDHAASTTLAGALLHRLPDVPPALHALLTAGAEGNPFFMEELVNMLVDQGVIATSAQGWQVHAARLPELAVPTTLAGVLHARLDALPAQERQLLEAAAVVGVAFWDDALRALGVPSLAPLRSLVGRDLVVEAGRSTLQGQREYRFRHQALHQAVYERLLKRFRRGAHARVAAWLAAQPGAAPELVADHYERGGEPARALDGWQRAAETAHERFALAGALQHCDRALALAAGTDLARRWTLTHLRARVLDHLSAHDALPATLDALDALAEQLGDDGRRARVLERRGRYHFECGDAAMALACAQRALALADRRDADCAIAAHAMVVFALGRLGRYVEARAAAAEALARARAGGVPRIEAMLLNEMGNYFVEAGEFGQALEYLERALALHKAAGDRLNEGGTLANLAFVAMTLGEYGLAQTQFEQAMALSASIGQHKNEGLIRTNLGLVLLNQGRAAAAQAQARQAVQLLRSARNRWGEAAALRVEGQATQALGDAEAALQLLRGSRDLFDQLEMPHLAIEAIAALAQAALERGDLAAAGAEVEVILARLATGLSLEGTDEPLRIRLVCWQVLERLADPRAADQLAQTWSELSARAARIAEGPRRLSFLEAVPFHRQIRSAWLARQSAPAGAVTGS